MFIDKTNDLFLDIQDSPVDTNYCSKTIIFCPMPSPCSPWLLRLGEAKDAGEGLTALSF